MSIVSECNLSIFKWRNSVTLLNFLFMLSKMDYLRKYVLFVDFWAQTQIICILKLKHVLQRKTRDDRIWVHTILNTRTLNMEISHWFAFWNSINCLRYKETKSTKNIRILFSQLKSLTNWGHKFECVGFQFLPISHFSFLPSLANFH